MITPGRILAVLLAAGAIVGGTAILLQVRAGARSEALREAILRNDAATGVRLLREGVVPPASLMGRPTLLYLGERGGSELSQALVQAGTKPNVQGTDGETPLLWALRRADAPLAAALLKHGADPNTPNEDGWTPLTVAILTDQDDTAMLLIGAGARADPPAPGADPILTLAARRSSPRVIEALLKNGARVDVQGGDGGTPLIETAKRGDDAVMNLFLAAGADPNAPDGSERSALAHTLLAGHGWMESGGSEEFAVQEQAWKYLGPDRPRTRRPFRRVSDRNVGGMVEALVQRGADVNQRFPGWMPSEFTDRETELTPLIAAAVTGDTKAVEVLLARGARVREVDSEGRTALMLAATHANAGMVRALLGAGADAKARDRKGQTALKYARNTHKGAAISYRSGREQAQRWARRDPTLARGLSRDLARRDVRHQRAEAERAQVEQLLIQAGG